jgi:hypothetical protein
MSKCPFHHPVPEGSDPFKEVRESVGVLHTQFQGRAVPMILTHEGVVATAKDWHHYSSDAPVRVPIPSEEDVRTVRQYPLELDLPEHHNYRKTIEPFFNRPKDPQMIAAVGALVDNLIDRGLAKPDLEIVYDFAIPLQSRALAVLTNAPEGDADLWISWGTHVFRDKEGKSKGFFLENYCAGLLDRALENPRDDLFTALTQMEIQGRPLTREEQLGYLNIVFAGGRDTIIHTITGVIGFFGEHRDALLGLRERPDLSTSLPKNFSAYFRQSPTSAACYPNPPRLAAASTAKTNGFPSAGPQPTEMPRHSPSRTWSSSTANQIPTSPSAADPMCASAPCTPD